MLPMFLSRSLSAIALAATVIGLLAPRSEAAIITGEIMGGFQDYNNLGLVIPYHATYRYDDANWTSMNSSDQDYTKIKYRAPLEYFSYSSVGYGGGYVSTNILGFDYIEVEDTYDSNPPSSPDQAWNEFNRLVTWSANISPGNFLAYASLTISRSNSQVGSVGSLAGLTNGPSGWGVYSQNLVDIRPNPLGVASVPTPAMLPGLVGFGVGLFRRRKLAAHPA
jgi:hypothetical protein